MRILNGREDIQKNIASTHLLTERRGRSSDQIRAQSSAKIVDELLLRAPTTTAFEII